jgi:hypothetical protein
MHVLCGIRTHDPSFRESEDSSYLRPLGYCDWRYSIWLWLTYSETRDEETEKVTDYSKD